MWFVKCYTQGQEGDILVKVGCIHIQLDQMLIAKIHLLAEATTGRWSLQVLSTRTFRYLSVTPTNIFKIIYLKKWREL